jgi:hypothetical protein
VSEPALSPFNQSLSAKSISGEQILGTFEK